MERAQSFARGRASDPAVTVAADKDGRQTDRQSSNVQTSRIQRRVSRMVMVSPSRLGLARSPLRRTYIQWARSSSSRAGGVQAGLRTRLPDSAARYMRPRDINGSDAYAIRRSARTRRGHPGSTREKTRGMTRTRARSLGLASGLASGLWSGPRRGQRPARLRRNRRQRPASPHQPSSLSSSLALPGPPLASLGSLGSFLASRRLARHNCASSPAPLRCPRSFPGRQTWPSTALSLATHHHQPPLATELGETRQGALDNTARSGLPLHNTSLAAACIPRRLHPAAGISSGTGLQSPDRPTGRPVSWETKGLGLQCLSVTTGAACNRFLPDLRVSGRHVGIIDCRWLSACPAVSASAWTRQLLPLLLLLLSAVSFCCCPLPRLGCAHLASSAVTVPCPPLPSWRVESGRQKSPCCSPSIVSAGQAGLALTYSTCRAGAWIPQLAAKTVHVRRRSREGRCSLFLCRVVRSGIGSPLTRAQPIAVVGGQG